MRRDRRLNSASKRGYSLIASKPSGTSDMVTPCASWGSCGRPASLAGQFPGQRLLDRRQHAGGVGAVVGDGEPRDGGVDQGRPARRERLPERRLELLQGLGPVALRAARLG